MTIEAILCDVDGTLVDSTALHARAWVDAVPASDIVRPLAKVLRPIGKGGDNLMPARLDADVGDRQGEAISTAGGAA